MKGKTIPKDFNIKDIDPDGNVAVSEEGGMNTQIWEEIAMPMIVRSAPACRDSEWRLLSLDGFDPHAHSDKALRYAYDHKILIFIERSRSSHMLQPCDVTIFGPLSQNLEIENMLYIGKFGTETLTQWEYPRIYKLAIDKALTISNIKSGFKACGLYPTLNAEEWLLQNRNKYNIMSQQEFDELLSKNSKPSELHKLTSPRSKKRGLDALNLSPPKKRRYSLPIPPIHNRKKKICS